MRVTIVFTLLILAVVAIFREAPVVAVVLAGLAMVMVLTDRRR